MRKYFLTLSVLFFLLGCILVYQNITYNDKKLHVVICDVGQGDAIFIRTPKGSDILIDGGPDNSILSCLAKHMPFWDRTIEVMILTHPHADHLAGLIDVLERYNILAFGGEKIENPTEIYKEFLKQLEKEGVRQRFLLQNDKFVTRDGVILKTFWPTLDWINRNPTSGGEPDINGSSVIELLVYGNFKALFTGDSQASTLNNIDSAIGKIDFLLVPHHGSRTGLNLKILNILDPKLAAISVGKNSYGHPTAFILDSLRLQNISIMRTDQIGDIEIISDGKTWKIN